MKTNKIEEIIYEIFAYFDIMIKFKLKNFI